MPAPADVSAGLARYQRQMLLQDWGEVGQRRLSRAHAMFVGVGALGCAGADLLARAGVGTLTLIDRDIVEATNLQRQTLFTERDVGLPKVEAAARRLAEINSSVQLRALALDLTHRNAEGLLPGRDALPGVDILVDATDNFETRYLLNDLAVKRGLPYAYAGVVGTRGMQATFLPASARRKLATPCLRCLFDEPPAPGSAPTCDTAGVLGPAVAIVAGAQSTDVLKVLLGREDLLAGALLEFDVWTNERRRLALGPPRGDCPCCVHARYEFLEASRTGDWGVLCGQDAVQISPPEVRGDLGVPGASALDLDGLARRLAGVGDIARTAFMVRARLTPDGPHSPALELSVFADGRAIVRGTTRADVARSIYAKYVGA